MRVRESLHEVFGSQAVQSVLGTERSRPDGRVDVFAMFTDLGEVPRGLGKY